MQMQFVVHLLNIRDFQISVELTQINKAQMEWIMNAQIYLQHRRKCFPLGGIMYVNTWERRVMFNWCDTANDAHHTGDELRPPDHVWPFRSSYLRILYCVTLNIATAAGWWKISSSTCRVALKKNSSVQFSSFYLVLASYQDPGHICCTGLGWTYKTF